MKYASKDLDKLFPEYNDKELVIMDKKREEKRMSVKPPKKEASKYKQSKEAVLDNVNHPSHYLRGGLETIDVIEAFTSDLNGMEAVCTGNALKYLCRWKEKNGIEDLKKANWYINKLISIMEEEK